MKKNLLGLVFVVVFIGVLFSFCDLFTQAGYMTAQATGSTISAKPEPLFYDVKPFNVSHVSFDDVSTTGQGITASLTVKNLGKTIDASKVLLVRVRTKEGSDAYSHGGQAQTIAVPLRSGFILGGSIPVVLSFMTEFSIEDFEVCVALSATMPPSDAYYVSYTDLENEAEMANNCEDLD
ncbi:MAG: hypothetical protein HQM16_09160 [Deltaproteobacteria bacterium]|nr:hypothetical protein [Deltaproteobacteria bacterium]